MTRWVGVVVAAGMVAACSGRGGESAAPPSGVELVGGEWATPEVTATPVGPISLTGFNTAGGVAATTMGKCIGFTVVGNGATFDAATTVELGPLGVVPTQLVDPTHLRVGSPLTSYACVYTPIYGTPGAWDLTVHTGGETIVVPAALAVGAPVVFDVGAVEKTRVWSDDLFAAAPGANTFERPYDVDIYAVTFSTAYHVYGHMDFFDKSASGLLPRMEYWNSHWPDSYLGKGANALIFPEPGLNWIVVRDWLGQGGSGADYDISFIGDELATTHPTDTCAGAPNLPPNGYHVDYDSLANDFDPMGNPGCLDSTYGTPVFAPGHDAVWTVTVPAGMTLAAAGYDDHIDNVLMLIPYTDDGSSCHPEPDNCVRAASHFGGGETDTLRYVNDTGNDAMFYLVSDSATVMSNAVGSFLVNMEIFDRD